MERDRVKELDELYERAHHSPGWLSYLLEAQTINEREAEYLVWRDEANAPTEAALRRFEANIERQGGIEVANAETKSDLCEALRKRITGLEERAQQLPEPINKAFKMVHNYYPLLQLFTAVKFEISNTSQISDNDLSHAREYRLDDLLRSKGLLEKGKFMKCPVHEEKHGSFYVTAFGYCFGCLKSWDAISWVMEFDRKSFVEAVQHLARLA